MALRGMRGTFLSRSMARPAPSTLLHHPTTLLHPSLGVVAAMAPLGLRSLLDAVEDAPRQVVQVVLSPKIALAVGTLAAIFCVENTFCMDTENTPSPATAAGARDAAARGAAGDAASVLARADGAGNFEIRDFFNDKKCLACDKNVSCSSIQRLLFHLLPSEPTPLCSKLHMFPPMHGETLTRQEVIAIATALNKQATARTSSAARKRQAADETEEMISRRYQAPTVPPAFRESTQSTPSSQSSQLQLTQQHQQAAAAEEASGDSYRRNSIGIAGSYTTEEVGLQMARATMCGGLSNGWADEPSMRLFLKMYRKTPGFQNPGRKTLGGKLIPKDYENVVSHVNQQLRETCALFGLGQASDGVTGHRHRSIMSYLLLMPSTAFFHRLEYTKGETKDMAYLVAKHKGIIDEIQTVCISPCFFPVFSRFPQYFPDVSLIFP